MTDSAPGGPAAEAAIDWDAGGIETELGWSLQAVYQGFARTAVTAVDAVPGGPRGYQVLVAVTTEPATSQLLLAQRLGIDKTAMTYVVDALENAGLVQRRANPRDRRVREVLPTDSGRALLARARVALREVEETLMHALDAGERTQLRHLLARVALSAGAVEACSPLSSGTPAEQPLAAPHRSARRTPRPSTGS